MWRYPHEDVALDQAVALTLTTFHVYKAHAVFPLQSRTVF